MALLNDAFIYLAAAVIAVPLANRLGLGSVLGYLIGGVVIGPLLGLVGDEAADVRHFAEFGVVMMLFLVGLELQPAMLWRMRHQLVGMGGLQVLGTSAVLGGAALAFGLDWQSAAAVGMILALSSTAIVIQTLTENAWLRTTGGQSSFAVLLTQDIAVIPMLALLPLLAMGHGGADAAAHGHEHGRHGLSDLAGWAQAAVTLGVIVGIVLAGRFLMRPVFRLMADARLREVFTAAALLLVVGVALLMSAIGLSPALGTFLAGVVLSDSDYRHELQSDIDPFKGLLLGLFFLTVGAGIDFGLLFGNPSTILALTLGLLALKASVLYGLGTAFGLRGGDRWLFSLGLAQAGEFAFVLFGFAISANVLDLALVQTLTLVVALSMILSPGLFVLYDRVLAPRSVSREDRPPDTIDEGGPVIIAGMGRFGQVVARLLITGGHRVVVLDHDPDRVDRLGKVGLRTYYGDALRPDLLQSAGLGEAKLFVAALDNPDQQIELVSYVRRANPGIRIFARAYDRHHVYALENAGADVVERELFGSALALGRQALVALGAHPFRAETQARRFRKHDQTVLDDLRGKWNTTGVDKSYIASMRGHTEALVELMASDRSASRHDTTERAWTPPPKGDADL